jgi:hypothetical protein
MPDSSRIDRVTVRNEGTRVLLIGPKGELLLSLPWQAAGALADALKFQSNIAKEKDNPVALIKDQALLLEAGKRSGLFLGMVHDPDILKEACKEAGGIDPSIVGTPKVESRGPSASV